MCLKTLARLAVTACGAASGVPTQALAVQVSKGGPGRPTSGPDRACDCDRAPQTAPGARPAAPNGPSERTLGSQAGRRRYPPSEGPRLPVGRVLEVEDGPVGASAEVHRVRGMDGTIEVSHGAEIVPRRVHEQPAAQAALSQPPEQPGTRAA